MHLMLIVLTFKTSKCLLLKVFEPKVVLMIVVHGASA